jgi:hypothetical protein
LLTQAPGSRSLHLLDLILEFFGARPEPGLEHLHLSSERLFRGATPRGFGTQRFDLGAQRFDLGAQRIYLPITFEELKVGVLDDMAQIVGLAGPQVQLRTKLADTAAKSRHLISRLVYLVDPTFRVFSTIGNVRVRGVRSAVASLGLTWFTRHPAWL